MSECLSADIDLVKPNHWNSNRMEENGFNCLKKSLKDILNRGL